MMECHKGVPLAGGAEQHTIQSTISPTDDSDDEEEELKIDLDHMEDEDEEEEEEVVVEMEHDADDDLTSNRTEPALIGHSPSSSSATAESNDETEANKLKMCSPSTSTAAAPATDDDKSSTSTLATPDTQLERDKKAVYAHPLFPLLALLFEKCEIATSSINAFESDPNLSSFDEEIFEFINHQQKLGKSFLTDDSEVDSLMIHAIQVFRIQLLELEKVSDLCKDFCLRYISCLRTKMRSDVLLQGLGEVKSGGGGGGGSSNELNNNLLDDDSTGGITETTLARLLLENNENSSNFLSTSTRSTASSNASDCMDSPAGPTHEQQQTRAGGSSAPSSPAASSVASSSHELTLPNLTMNPADITKALPQYLGLNLSQAMSLFNGKLMTRINFDSEEEEDSEDEDNDKDSHEDEQLNEGAQDLSLKSSRSSVASANNNNSTDNADDESQRLVTSNTILETLLHLNVAKTDDKKKKKLKKKTTMVLPKGPEKKHSLNSSKGSAGGARGGGHAKRGVLPKQATSIMRSWLFQHIVHPYPTEDEKRAIATETNLTLLQVNNWFINARRRILQPMLDSAQTLQNELLASAVNNNNNNNAANITSNMSIEPAVGALLTEPQHQLPIKLATGKASKKLKSSSSPGALVLPTMPVVPPASMASVHHLNRFWPQSLANIIQTGDLKRSS